MAKRKVYISKTSGHFVSEKYAKAHPKTTKTSLVTITVPANKKKKGAKKAAAKKRKR